MKLVTLAACAASVLATEYADENIINPLNNDHTSYYDDTVPSRIPPWVKEEPYRSTQYQAGPPEQQVSGAWNTDHSAINLGNGVKTGTSTIVGSGNGARTVTGTSSSAEANLIAAARAAFGNKDSREPNPNDNNEKVWDHIRNFWYRDGDLFALMLDDNACDMMGGGVYYSHKKQDVVTHIGNNTLTYEIRDEDHHMEYLRDFCEEMGGDLWAPSSQAEYDDLFERKDGICDKTGQVYENGEPFGTLGWNKIEVYLNLHREGYLQCPDADRVQTDPGTPCPTENYYNSPNTCNNECNNNRNLENNAPSTTADDFYTTDSYFGTKDDICGNNIDRNIFTYSKFLAKSSPDPNICPESTGGEPFINEQCWDGTQKNNGNGNVERFQKFIEQDVYTINRILSQSGGTVQRQKDCVVAICNDGPPTEAWTGPLNDQRRKSEWNMDHCNQQRHVGICRMKLTGCNKASYACKDNYSKSCGDRSVFTESFTMFKNAAVQQAMEDLKNQGGNTVAQNSGIDDPSSEDTTATGNRDVVFTNGDAKADVQNFLTSIGETTVEVVDGNTPTDAPGTCPCDCSFNTWAKFSNAADIGTTVIADSQVVRVPSSSSTIQNSLSSTVSYTCQDANSCYSGSAEAQCVMKNNGYEAAWSWSGNTVPGQSICTSSCCPSQDLTPDGSMVIKSGGKTVYKDGDQVVLECTNPNNHLSGDESTNTITITAGFTNPTTPCFTPPSCETPNCKTCPTIANGYCYDNNNLGSTATSWAPGTKLRCRCNRCFMMKNSASGFPWLSTTCVPNWTAEQGECVPLKCANPRDLVDVNGNLIGWPVGSSKAGCGETIEYECAEGFVADMAGADDSSRTRPYSLCDDASQWPNENEGEKGSQGFFSQIQGTCKPKTCKVADLGDETDAWKPVFFANGLNGNQCHAAATYKDSTLVNAQKLLPSELPEGALAIYECYDDYNAVQNTDFRETSYDVVQELACASGPKTDADDCRLQQTDKLIENWISDNQKTIATNNDKLIARCVNGEWVKPSHHCLCNDQPLTTSVKYFEAVCPAQTDGRAPNPTPTSSAVVHKLGFGMIPLAFYVGF